MKHKIVFAIAVLAWQLPVHAQEGEPTHSEENNCSSEEHFSCVNGVSSTVTGFDSLRVAMTAAPGSAREHDEDKNTAAQKWVKYFLGGPDDSAAYWLSLNHSRFDSNAPSTLGRIRYEGELNTISLGMDNTLANGTVVGLSIASEERTTETEYNGGEEDSDGHTFSLYLVHPMGDSGNVSGLVGYGDIATNQSRVDPNDGSTLSAEFDSDRLYASVQYGHQILRQSWLFNVSGGLLHAREEVDGYSESGGGGAARTVNDKTLELNQINLGASADYLLHKQDLYAYAGYRRDFSRDDGASAGGLPGSAGNVQPDDKDEFELALGWRYYWDESFNAGLEVLSTQGRDRFSNELISLSISGRF